MDKDFNKHESPSSSDAKTAGTDALTKNENVQSVSTQSTHEHALAKSQQSLGESHVDSARVDNKDNNLPETELTSHAETPEVRDCAKANSTPDEVSHEDAPIPVHPNSNTVENVLTDKETNTADDIPLTDVTAKVSHGEQQVISAIKNTEELLQNTMSNLLSEFQSKLRYDKTKEKQVDTLHNELQEYKKDLLMKATKPLINGIIKIYVDICKQQDALPKKQEKNGYSNEAIQHIHGELNDVLDDIEMVFELNAINVYSSQQESNFDVSRQRVLQKVTTEEADLVGKVARAVRPGFESTKEILHKELIDLYVAK